MGALLESLTRYSLLGSKSQDYQGVVAQGMKLLKQQGAVEDSYGQAIIDIYQKYGPYFVIAPSVAIPHARPEMGALRNACALVTMKEPLSLGSPNDPVYIFLFFSAINNAEHVGTVMVELMRFLQESTRVQALIEAKTVDNLRKIL